MIAAHEQRFAEASLTGHNSNCSDFARMVFQSCTAHAGATLSLQDAQGVASPLQTGAAPTTSGRDR